MQTTYKIFRLNKPKADKPHHDWSGFFTTLFILNLLLTACGAAKGLVAQATGNSVEGLPGKEEFGLTREELVTSIEAEESLIAGCMREAGFEYVAVDYNTVRKEMTADKSLPGLSEKEFFDQY